MANDDGGHWWDNGWEDLPDEWSARESSLFDDFAEKSETAGIHDDQMLQALYDAALFDFDISHEDRLAIRETLKDYVWEEYGIDFDDVFDWESWRENYDSTS